MKTIMKAISIVKSKFKTVIESVKSVETTETTSLDKSNRRFVNPDGTIAESLKSHRQFCADLNNRSYGW